MSLAAAFGVSNDGARVGVVTFSYNAELSIKLGDHSTLFSFNEAVDKIPLMGYTTRIDKALRLSLRELFLMANGGRRGIPKILILMTDGSQTQDADAEDPSIIASEIRSKGIKLVVIGIGSGVDQEELGRLGNNQKDNIFTVSTFEDLLNAPFINSVTNSSCNAGKVVSYICLNDSSMQYI